ncbi:MAG TPA: hypothetical protein VJN90_11140 [Candidatus Acidoferrales bacterium]|nr:hypothetical protein [Candidatus Acidoferrales bacterium]
MGGLFAFIVAAFRQAARTFKFDLRKGIVSNFIEDLQTRFDELKKRIDLVRSYL